MKMAMTKTAAILLVVGLLVGYGVGFVVYQQQISQLQSDLSETQNQLAELLNSFSMQVIPADMVAIPGQRCALLVVVEGGRKEQGVSISATINVSDSEVTIEPEPPGVWGQVTEVTVIPDEASVNSTLTVTITGERDGFTQTETTTIQVIEGPSPGPLPREHPLAEDAAKVLDRFIPLLSQFPELGITNETEWSGTVTRPFHFIVSFYLFFSDEWEMGLCWHAATFPPHDYARIYLRHRFTEVRPSYVFDISSYHSEDAEPYIVYFNGIVPPAGSINEVWR